MDILEMEDMNENHKKIYHFFKQLRVEDIQKLIIDTNCSNSLHFTYFQFKLKDETNVIFYYALNARIESIRVLSSNTILYVDTSETYKKWAKYIWNQFVDHFNLRIRLFFINEMTPWLWNTEFTY